MWQHRCFTLSIFIPTFVFSSLFLPHLFLFFFNILVCTCTTPRLLNNPFLSVQGVLILSLGQLLHRSRLPHSIKVMLHRRSFYRQGVAQGIFFLHCLLFHGLILDSQCWALSTHFFRFPVRPLAI